jgi:phage N-6-adenine-methyltransferase
MTITPVLYSSATDEWPTPPAFFAQLDRRYRFTLDPCATSDNAKCPLYFTREQDGLKQDWGTHRVFCNPPYGRRTIGAWVRKCFESSQGGALVVLLVPARTDTRWYHDWIEGKADIKFIRGRLRFGNATLARHSLRCSRSTHLTGPLRRAPDAVMVLSLAAMLERVATLAGKRSTAVEMLRLRCNEFTAVDGDGTKRVQSGLSSVSLLSHRLPSR